MGGSFQPSQMVGGALFEVVVPLSALSWTHRSSSDCPYLVWPVRYPNGETKPVGAENPILVTLTRASVSAPGPGPTSGTTETYVAGTYRSRPRGTSCLVGGPDEVFGTHKLFPGQPDQAGRSNRDGC